MNNLKKLYEEPQLIDLEEEVGCDWVCATGGEGGAKTAATP